MDNYSVIFDGNDLSLIPGVDLHNHNFNLLPSREIKINKLARQDKSIITSSEYSQKDIPIWFEVCDGSRQDTELAVTELKTLVQGQNKLLQVLQAGEETQYVCTMNEFNIEWEGTTAIVQIMFIASDPIGERLASQTLFSGAITSSTATLTAVVQGSFKVEPIITITVTAVSGGSGGQMTIKNANTQQGITISHDFLAGDVITINSQAKTLTINGTNSDFGGTFPIYYPPTQSLGYTDTFTTRTIALTSSYKPRLV